MGETATTYVTQSKYFSPAFNAAIFDGPIRIYFAQYQEAQALKLYFNLQERYSEVRKQARGIFKERGCTIFVMLYPNSESFETSFGGFSDSEAARQAAIEAFDAENEIVQERFGSDFVVGVRGPLEQDETLERLCLEMDRIVKTANA